MSSNRIRHSNLLIDNYPELLSEWDYEKNTHAGINADTITCGSHAKIWWLCSGYKHSYQSPVYNRVQGRGCPYCAGKKVLVGFNDLRTKYPKLIESEWDWIENDKHGIHPDEIISSSNAKVNWHCNKCSGKYEMRVYDKINGQGCPYCAGKRVLSGSNDLQTLYPDLVMNEWDYENNNASNITPDKVTCGSNKKVWWHCNKCNGKYEMSINSKTSGRGCPYCAGKQVLVGFNDLASKYPDLIKEWDYERNNANGIKPDEVTYGSNKTAWWHCNKCNGKYEMSINSKTNGQGCPFCAGKQVLIGYNDLQTKYPDLIMNEWDYVNNNANNITPDGITSGSHVKAWWHCITCGGKYEMTVNNKISGHQGCPFCAGAKVLEGYNDLASCYHDVIALEWDYDKNSENGLNPDEVTCGSNRKAWWHCNTCYGKYEMSICNRIIKARGCPYCTNQKILIGYNDLASQFPDLVMNEWDYDKNSKHGLKPDEITYGSHSKAWWKCSKCKHEWETVVKNRTFSKSGCPACAKRVSRQENEVAEYVNTYLSKHYVNMKYTMFRSIKFKKIYDMLGIDTEQALNDSLQSHLLKEIDIYIPELGLAIEYDGDYWHSDEVMLRNKGMTNSDAHMIKQLLCKHVDIELMFISEHDWLNDTENVRNNIKETIDNMGYNLSHWLK